MPSSSAATVRGDSESWVRPLMKTYGWRAQNSAHKQSSSEYRTRRTVCRAIYSHQDRHLNEVELVHFAIVDGNERIAPILTDVRWCFIWRVEERYGFSG